MNSGVGKSFLCTAKMNQEAQYSVFFIIIFGEVMLIMYLNIYCVVHTNLLLLILMVLTRYKHNKVITYFT